MASIHGVEGFHNKGRQICAQRLVEELCREKNIRRVDREPCTPFPLKNIPNLNISFIKRAAADRAREASALLQSSAKVEGIELKESGLSQPQASTFSPPEAQSRPVQVRLDYRGHGDPVEPAYEPHKYARLAQNLSVSEQGIDFIKRHEGFVPYLYDDSESKNIKTRITHKNLKLVKGTLTIGYGFTKAAYPKINDYLNENTPKMTQEEADTILRNITVIISGYIKHYWKSPSSVILKQHEFDALISLIYNIGIGNYIKSPIYLYLNKGDKEKAGLEISNFMTDKGLNDRRKKESTLFLNGTY